jgi:hypothetical protein
MNISNNNSFFNQSIHFVAKQKNNLLNYTISLLKNCQLYPSLTITLIAINALAVYPIAVLVHTNLDAGINKLSKGKLKNKLETYSFKIVNVSVLAIAALITVVATASLKLPLSQKQTVALSLLTNIVMISLYNFFP